MSRGKDQGEVHRHRKDWARPVGGLGEGSRSLHDTAPSCFLGTPSSATGLRLGELEAPRKKARVHLFTPYKILMTITPLTPGWLGSLRVPHWQLVACGQGPLCHQLMAEQDHQRWVEKKKFDNTIADDNMEQLELLYTTGTSINWTVI